jgi:hypothetical protein
MSLAEHNANCSSLQIKLPFCVFMLPKARRVLEHVGNYLPVDMTYWLTNLQWVWAPTFPMHLDLIDRPFVPQKLIPAEQSPVPLPKLLMAPRHKILMSSGSKKGTQIYYPFLSKKSVKVKPLQIPERGPCEERYPLTGHFYISLYMCLYLKSRMKRASLSGPQKRTPYGNRRPCQSLTWPFNAERLIKTSLSEPFNNWNPQ